MAATIQCGESVNQCGRLAAAIATLAMTVGLAAAAATDSRDESVRVADWRSKRLTSLTSETGWLTPVALYWLKDGENTVGRASTQDFSLDDSALAPDTGVFILKDHEVRYVAHAANALTHEGQPITSIDLVSDRDGMPTELVAGTLHFVLIDRAGHLGVRVRDSVSPNRQEFKGLQYFPVRADWLLQARFEPYVPEHRIQIVNILGMTEEMVSPGAIVFRREGHSWRLDTILEEPGDDELLVMFSDQTSGSQTYGAGRFLYVGLPKGHRIEVDFNTSFNPPCAFTDFATCPLPPEQNRLALPIEAGELKYERAH